MAGVRASVGVPVKAQFNLGPDVTPCAPIVVNSTTGQPYTLTSADAVVAVATVVEGTWTPVDSSGAALTFSTAVGRYSKIGSMVTVTFRVVYPATVNASAMLIGGLPFAGNADAAPGGGSLSFDSIGAGLAILGLAVTTSAATFTVRTTANATPTNAQLTLGDLRGQMVYFT